MVIHPSQKFVKRLKCTLSLSEKSPLQQAKLDSWSGDILKIPKVGEFAILMNDASLSTLIFQINGIKSFDQLLPVMLDKISALLAPHGKSFDVENQRLLFLKRSDRSLIGTMNELKFLAEDRFVAAFNELKPIDLKSIEQYLNEIPYSRINYDSPKSLLSKFLL